MLAIAIEQFPRGFEVARLIKTPALIMAEAEDYFLDVAALGSVFFEIPVQDTRMSLSCPNPGTSCSPKERKAQLPPRSCAVWLAAHAFSADKVR